jgi:hypothetical protein
LGSVRIVCVPSLCLFLGIRNDEMSSLRSPASVESEVYIGSEVELKLRNRWSQQWRDRVSFGKMKGRCTSLRVCLRGLKQRVRSKQCLQTTLSWSAMSRQCNDFNSIPRRRLWIKESQRFVQWQ